MPKAGPAVDESALASWQRARQRLWLRAARPAIALAWLLTALILFQQLLFAAYGYALRITSAYPPAVRWVEGVIPNWVALVLTVYPRFTYTVGPILALAVEFTPLLAIAMALWQLSLQRLPAELVVTQLPAEIYAHRLRLVRRVYSWWIGLLCIIPVVSQVVLSLGVRRMWVLRWRGSPEEEVLLTLAGIAALLAVSQLAQLLQLRRATTLALQWHLLLPGSAFVLLRSAIAAAEVLARDRSAERLTLWDPPHAWHALGILVLTAALIWGTVQLRAVNSHMPQWYRGL